MSFRRCNTAIRRINMGNPGQLGSCCVGKSISSTYTCRYSWVKKPGNLGVGSETYGLVVQLKAVLGAGVGAAAVDVVALGRVPIHEVMSSSPQDREYLPVISQVGIEVAALVMAAWATGARGPTVTTPSAAMSGLARTETRDGESVSMNSHEVKWAILERSFSRGSLGNFGLCTY